MGKKTQKIALVVLGYEMPPLRKEPERAYADDRIKRREDLPPCSYARTGAKYGRVEGSKKTAQIRNVVISRMTEQEKAKVGTVFTFRWEDIGMGREVRMVPKGWEHPKNEKGNYIPLMSGPYSERVKAWYEENAQWQKGFRSNYENGWQPKEEKYKDMPFDEWYGAKPVKEKCMPEWAPGEARMLVMYEDTSEGTPISPAFETTEELAHWLVDNGASAFGDMTSTYEEWTNTCSAGYAVGMVMDSKSLRSGVAL